MRVKSGSSGLIKKLSSAGTTALRTGNTQLRNSRSQFAPRAFNWARSFWVRQPAVKVLISVNSRLTELGTCAGIKTYWVRNGSSRTSVSIQRCRLILKHLNSRLYNARQTQQFARFNAA